jgi:hypothetical protein
MDKMDLLKLTTYLGAPFYGYPWKPLFNEVYGAGYDRAYQHFRRDHSDT